MRVKKLNRPNKERVALIRNQATDLLWHGKITTTEAKAKYLRSYVEKLITLAVNSYEDVIKVEKAFVDEKGVKSNREVIIDGPKKLAARRKIMAKVYTVEEKRLPKEKKSVFVARTEGIKHPLIEKIFNIYAPKYAERKNELKIGGGYTRIVKVGKRIGDNADMMIIELI